MLKCGNPEKNSLLKNSQTFFLWKYIISLPRIKKPHSGCQCVCLSLDIMILEEVCWSKPNSGIFIIIYSFIVIYHYNLLSDILHMF